MNYRCPDCNKSHSADEWNHATSVECNLGRGIIAPLPDHHGDDETFFYCPSCNSKVYGHELSIDIPGKADEGSTLIVGRMRETNKDIKFVRFEKDGFFYIHYTDGTSAKVDIKKIRDCKEVQHAKEGNRTTGSQS
jgi:hypothetical protein